MHLKYQSLFHLGWLVIFVSRINWFRMSLIKYFMFTTHLFHTRVWNASCDTRHHNIITCCQSVTLLNLNLNILAVVCDVCRSRCVSKTGQYFIGSSKWNLCTNQWGMTTFLTLFLFYHKLKQNTELAVLIITTYSGKTAFLFGNDRNNSFSHLHSVSNMTKTNHHKNQNSHQHTVT